MFKRKTAERIFALGLAVACGFFPINTVTKAAGTERKIISTSQTADYEDGIIDYNELNGSLEIQKQPNTNNHEVRFGIKSGIEATWTTDMLSSEGNLGSETKMKFRLDSKASDGYWYISWFLRRINWQRYYRIEYAHDGTLKIVKVVIDEDNQVVETTLPKTKDGTEEATLTISPQFEVSDTYHDITMSISGDATTGNTISVTIDGKYNLTAYDSDGYYPNDAEGSKPNGKFGMKIVNQSVCFDDLTRTCYAAEDWDTSVWSAVDTKPDLVEDSAIDLSYMNDAPAGSKGFLKIDPNGDFYFENEPGKTVKFFGTNINGSYAIEPSHAQTDKIVDRLSKMGYNAVRFCGVDCCYSWAQGVFKKPTSTTVEFNEEKLESFDYLMSKLKEKGIYVYIEVLGALPFDEIPSLSGYTVPSRALAIMTEDGMATWQSMADKLFNHVNQYTGIAYKDDPIFIGVSPWNEGLISNMTLRDPEAAEITKTEQLFLDDFNEYLTGKGADQVDRLPQNLWDSNEYWVDYLTDKTMTGYTTMKEYLQNSLGIQAPIGGLNSLNDSMIGYYRTASDVHETHSYNGLIEVGGAKTYKYKTYKHTPYSKTFSQQLLDNFYDPATGTKFANRPFANFIPAHSVGQLYQKPFALTEYNQQLPSEGRDQLAIISTASGAYNGWDSFLRFDFASSASATLNNIGYGQDAFNTVADPLVIATEFQGNLIFRKGNITLGETKFVMVVDKGFAKSYDSVFNGALTPELAYIPHLFKMETVFADKPNEPFAIYKLTENLTSEQIAAGNIPEENRLILYDTKDDNGKYSDYGKDELVAALKSTAKTLINSLDDEELKTTMLTNLDKNLLVTDTGELVFDMENGVYQVNTPYVSALSGTLNSVEYKLGDVSLKADNDEGTISVSSLDDKTLNDSNRMLVVYTTDVSAAGEKKEQVENEVVYTRGAYPALVKIATGEVKLSNLTLPAASYKAYKLDLNGSRVAEIPVTVSRDTITVPLKTDCGYYFEIVSDENPFTVDGKAINNFSELKANDTVTANVNISHNSTEEENVNLFLVLYDNNNRMIDASIEPLTLKPNQVSCLKTISLQLPEKIDNYHLNLMVWSDYDGGFKPLAEPKKLE